MTTPNSSEDAVAKLGVLAPTKELFGVAGVVAALAISVTSLVFTLWPSLSPDPKNEVGAKIAMLEFDRSVTLADFYERFPDRSRNGVDPATDGNVFYIRAVVEGFKRESLRLRWFSYEKTNRRRVLGLGSTAPLEEIFRQQAPVNTQIAQVWVPAPRQTGDYYVRFELYASGGVLLAFVDSPSFHYEGI